MENQAIGSSSGVAEFDNRQASKLKTLITRKREALKIVQDEKRNLEEKSTETWSGLRISDRCIRQERWDQSMRGKTLVRFAHMGGADPIGRDQVFIGVMVSAAVGPKSGPDGKEYAEWVLTDLDERSPQKISLILVGRALEHWSHKDGPCRKQATAGSIMAVLNPVLTGRAKAIRVSFETQLLKLGMCPSLTHCKAKDADGRECYEPFNIESGGDYCLRHASMSHGARQHHCTSSTAKPIVRPATITRSVASTSRPVASPLASSPHFCPSGVLLTTLQRAEAALDVESSPGMLKILKELESIQIDGVTLRHCKIYDKLGSLAQGQDAVANVAKMLRRRWRIVMDDAALSTQEERIQFSKRQRTGKS